ncbi:unnamed protein product [Urochloa humidicola]
MSVGEGSSWAATVARRRTRDSPKVMIASFELRIIFSSHHNTDTKQHVAGPTTSDTASGLAHLNFHEAQATRSPQQRQQWRPPPGCLHPSRRPTRRQLLGGHGLVVELKWDVDEIATQGRQGPRPPCSLHLSLGQRDRRQVLTHMAHWRSRCTDRADG